MSKRNVTPKERPRFIMTQGGILVRTVPSAAERENETN